MCLVVKSLLRRLWTEIAAEAMKVLKELVGLVWEKGWEKVDWGG